MIKQSMAMLSPLPTLMIHFVDDCYCNAVVYPGWFKRFAQGMEAPPSCDYGCRVKTFYSAVLQGGHDRGQRIQSTLCFDELEDDYIHIFWRALLGIP